MDLNVMQIVSIEKLPSGATTISSFRIIINDDTIKHNVYNSNNFDSGIIIKPYRFHLSGFNRDIQGRFESNQSTIHNNMKLEIDNMRHETKTKSSKLKWHK